MSWAAFIILSAGLVWFWVYTYSYDTPPKVWRDPLTWACFGYSSGVSILVLYVTIFVLLGRP